MPTLESMLYLGQSLDAGVDVATGHLGDDKVDGGSGAVVKIIKVGRDRADPGETHTTNYISTHCH